MTMDANARRSAALKGKPRPLEVRQKIGAAKRGKRLPREVREKISAALTGRKCSPERCENSRIAERVIKLFKPEAYEAKRKRARAVLLKCWQDPDFIARRAAGQKARWERYHAGKAATEAPTTTRSQQVTALLAQGMRKADIARTLGICTQRVSQICKKLTRFSDLEAA